MGVVVIVHWSHKAGICAVGERMSYQLYDYTARSYGAELRVVDELGECGIDGVPLYESLAEALKGLTGSIVCLSKSDPDAVELASFKHPEDAVYIIGPDYSGYVVPEGASSVIIPTPGPEYVELWSQVVAGIVLFDRATKATG